MWLLRAFVAFALSGLLGAYAGGCVGGTIGMFFFFVGSYPGAVMGALVGYLAAFLVLEAIVWFGIVCALGSFLHAHIRRPLFALPAAACDIYAIGALGATIQLWVQIRRIDYQGTIAVIQRQLEAARVLRINMTVWQFLAGMVVWAPFVIVAARGILGFDTYNVPWLCTNILLGVALIPIAIWSCRKFSERLVAWPFVQRLAKDIAGENLTAAREFLANLTDFELEAV